MMVPVAELAGQVLRQGGRLKIRARGASMLPFLLDGDIALVAPAHGQEIRVGDVICYEASPGSLLLHRVIKRDGDRFVARGDALRFTDVILRNEVLGKVLTIERHGRVRRLDTREARGLNRAIASVAPLLARLLPLALRVRRSWRAARCG